MRTPTTPTMATPPVISKMDDNKDIQLRPSAPTINPLAGSKIAPPVVTLRPSFSCGVLETLDKINVLQKNIVRRPSRSSLSGPSGEELPPPLNIGRPRAMSHSGASGNALPPQQSESAPAQVSFSFKPPQPPPPVGVQRRHTIVGPPGSEQRGVFLKSRPLGPRGDLSIGTIHSIPSLDSVDSDIALSTVVSQDDVAADQMGPRLASDLARGEAPSSPSRIGVRATPSSPSSGVRERRLSESGSSGIPVARVNSLPSSGSPTALRRDSKAADNEFFFSRGKPERSHDRADSQPQPEDPLSHLRRLAGSQPTSPQGSPAPITRRHSMRTIRAEPRPMIGPGASHTADRTSSNAGEKSTPPSKPADSWRSSTTITPSSRRATISGTPKETSLLRKILTEPKTTPTGEPVESLLDIRGRIHCKLFNYGDGVCPYQDKCHYRHAFRDGTLAKPDYIEQFTSGASDGLGGAPSLADMRSQIPCKLFNFGQGVCEYGASCYYRHCTKDGLVLEKTGSMSSLNRLRFQNPYGEGDICAAGLVPYNYTFVPDKFKDEGAIWALMQVEDIRVEGTKKWRAGLALFGGKVQEEDADWLETTAREFAEETGGLLGKFKPLQNLITGVPLKISCFRIEAATDAGSFTKYLGCKYQVLYYPIEDEDMNDFLQLPQRYWDIYQGQVSRDWTRAAVRMEPVVLRRVEVMREVLAAQEAAKAKEVADLANETDKKESEAKIESVSVNEEEKKSSESANEEGKHATEATIEEEKKCELANEAAENSSDESESANRRTSEDGDQTEHAGRSTERRQRRSSGSDGEMAQSWRSNSRVRNDSESSDSSERLVLPPRGWVVCDINTGNIHDLGCSVQLRQALEMADFPRPDKKPPKRVFKDVLAAHLDGNMGDNVGQARSTPPRLPAASVAPKSMLNGSALSTAAPRTTPRTTPPASTSNSTSEWARGTAAPRMGAGSPRIAPQVSSRTSITGAPVSPVPTRVASPIISPMVIPPPPVEIASATVAPPPVAMVSSVGSRVHEKSFREEMEELFEAHKNHIIVLLVALLLFVTMRA